MQQRTATQIAKQAQQPLLTAIRTVDCTPAATTIHCHMHSRLFSPSIAVTRANTGSPFAFYDTHHLGQKKNLMQIIIKHAHINKAMEVLQQHCSTFIPDRGNVTGQGLTRSAAG